MRRVLRRVDDVALREDAEELAGAAGREALLRSGVEAVDLS